MVDPNEYNNSLLNEISENRQALNGMLTTIQSIREQTTELLPKSTDFKNRHMMEEKIKAISSVFGVELDIRKQKENSIKVEIELRRKLGGEDDKISFDNIQDLAKAIEHASRANGEIEPMLILED